MPIIKISPDDYNKLKQEYYNFDYSIKDIAKKFNITPMQISRIAKQNCWQPRKAKISDKIIKEKKETLKKIKKEKNIAKIIQKENEKLQLDNDIKKEVKNRLKYENQIKMQTLTREEKENMVKAKSYDMLYSLLEDIQQVLEASNDKEVKIEEFEYADDGKVLKKKSITTKSKYDIMKAIGINDIFNGLIFKHNTSFNLYDNSIKANTINTQQNINNNENLDNNQMKIVEEAKHFIENQKKQFIVNDNDK